MHPYNVKRGRICIYYKVCLPLKALDIDYLQLRITIDLKMGDEICRFVTLYRSPNQFQDQFKSFSSNFELNVEKLAHKNYLLVVVIQSPTKHLE